MAHENMQPTSDRRTQLGISREQTGCLPLTILKIPKRGGSERRMLIRVCWSMTLEEATFLRLCVSSKVFGLALSCGGTCPRSKRAQAFVEVLYSLGKQAAEGVDGVEGAELAMPGPFDYGQGISWMKHKMPYLYGVNLSEALAARFGWNASQVRFLNDAAAYLLGEVGAGAAQGVKRVAVFTLGTGVGSGFAVDGRVVTDGKGVPPGGEIWNVPYAGGIVEDQISTRALQNCIQAAQRDRSAKSRRSLTMRRAASPCRSPFSRSSAKISESLLNDCWPTLRQTWWCWVEGSRGPRIYSCRR